MTSGTRARPWPAAKYRLLIWTVYMTAWTVALLIPIPIKGKWTVSEIDLKFLFAKSLHVAAYAVFAMLTGWLRVPSRFRWLLTFLLAVHATLTELFQQHVPGRTGRIEDICLDLGGVFLGCMVTWRWWAAEP
jgi:VanZ family protein